VNDSLAGFSESAKDNPMKKFDIRFGNNPRRLVAAVDERKSRDLGVLVFTVVEVEDEPEAEQPPTKPH
jgi:hypothetical protein